MSYTGTTIEKGMIVPGTTKINRNKAAANAAANKAVTNAAAAEAAKKGTFTFMGKPIGINNAEQIVVAPKIGNRYGTNDSRQKLTATGEVTYNAPLQTIRPAENLERLSNMNMGEGSGMAGSAGPVEFGEHEFVTPNSAPAPNSLTKPLTEEMNLSGGKRTKSKSKPKKSKSKSKKSKSKSKKSKSKKSKSKKNRKDRR